MLEAMQRAWAIPELKKRLLFVLGMLAVFALGAHVPAPGLGDPTKLAKLLGANAGNLLGLMDVFSGGALKRMSIFALGLQPYINSSIIMQMMTIAIPQLDALSKEGESGRKQIAKITRNITVILAIVQAFGLTFLFSRMGVHFHILDRLTLIVALVAGASLLLWLGEQVTQKGVGNGISLVIFAGILLSLPNQVRLVYAQIHAGTVPWFNLVLLLAAFFATVLAVVYVTQGTRRIPIQHTKRVIGMRQTQSGTSYLPIKVNSAGVIPIIFAISLMLFPATLVNLLPGQAGEPGFYGGLKTVMSNLSPGQTWYATALYALLVIVFTYFYTAIVMNVQEMADNLKKYGNYIPGIRPGKPTYDYLDRVISRITLAGAVFLAMIAVTQYIVPTITRFTSVTLVGGTSLLIIVGVAIETMQAIEAQLLMRNYEGFIKNKEEAQG
jgi:preprotein translocase subunit SecY